MFGVVRCCDEYRPRRVYELPATSVCAAYGYLWLSIKSEGFVERGRGRVDGRRAAGGGEMTISNKRKTTPNKATTSYVDALSYGT